MIAEDLLPERISGGIDDTDRSGCWIWQRSVNGSGYARANWNGRQVSVHRVTYELLRGPIPDGLQLDHLCRVRHCVNPWHCEPVTNRENSLRSTAPGGPGENFRKTHCPRGHEYSPENTYYRKGRLRECLACRRIIYYERHRATETVRKRNKYWAGKTSLKPEEPRA